MISSVSLARFLLTAMAAAACLSSSASDISSSLSLSAACEAIGKASSLHMCASCAHGLAQTDTHSGQGPKVCRNSLLSTCPRFMLPFRACAGISWITWDERVHSHNTV